LRDYERERSKRLLVLDDDVALLRMASLSLRLEGFEVTTAANGQLGLEEMQTQRFDLIVLELQMPVLDGRGFFREIRAAGFEQPVLILSAYGAEKARVQLGAQGAIEKPFVPEVLVDAVQAMIEQSASMTTRG
jgi:DNA-binding response OmpR family regulator